MPLTEVIDFREGPGILAKDFRDDGVPLVRLAGLTSGSLLDGCNYLDPSMVESKWSQFRVAPGDTLLSTSASLGRIGRVNDGSAGAIPYTGLIRMRPASPVLLSDYIPHILAAPSFVRQIESMGAGSVMQHFGPSHLRQMTVVVPPSCDQRSICEVLSAIDDKVASNGRLADLADTTWIANASGSSATGDAEAVEVAALVADGLLVVNDGYRAKNSELATTGMPFVRAGNLTAHGLDFDGADLAPPEVTSRAGNKVSAPWDTAFTSKGTVGRITLVDPNVETFLYSPQICFWRSLDHERLSPFVLHAWMRSGRFTAQIEAVKGQTDMADYVSLRDQRAMMFDLPSPERQAVVHSFAEPLANFAAAARREARTLTRIRDALLPKLVSGQIRVPVSDDVDEQLDVALEAVA